MITTSKTGITNFIQQCVNNGLKHVVCSPGSRNAPLVISFDEHPEIVTYVIHDERSAAFYALGIAQELNEPVAVVCTSGSAVANYYPAVTEAYYQSIPLVVISGDRPSEWVNHGDGQTIVQENIFQNHSNGFFSVPEFCHGASEEQTLINQINGMFDKCVGNWKGPIHFNCPLSEPLYDTREVDLQTKTREKDDNSKNLSQEQSDSILSAWKNAKKRLILCGQMPKDRALKDLLVEIGNDTSVAILVENTSNLVDRKFIHCIDRSLSIINEEEIKDFEPDLLITLGGAIISKRIKSFLRNADIKEHLRVGYAFPEMDTYRHLTQSIQANPKEVLRLITNEEQGLMPSSFGSKWKQKDHLASHEIRAIIDDQPYSDLKVFDLLLDYIPDDSYLHMSNSSVVRYCQLLNPIASVKYFANRGTSGIDGSTSTACGVALASPNKINVLITGDVSFFYDSNALWNHHISKNLRIILINNGGGGIFRIIDGPSKSKQLEKYFEAKHEHSAEHLAKAFNVEYESAHSLAEIEDVLQNYFSPSDSNRPKILEIRTPSEVNGEVLNDFFKRLGTS